MADKKDILIIEDSEAAGILLREYLQKLNYDKIYTCIDGGSGIEKFMELIRSNKTPIVFLDYNLPDMNGFSVMSQLLFIRPETKVIIETVSERSEPGIKNLIAHGAHHYLPKPIKFESLKEIMDVLEVKEQEVEAQKLHGQIDTLLKSYTKISLEMLSQYTNSDYQQISSYLEKLEPEGKVSRLEVTDISCNSCSSIKLAQIFHCPSCNKSNFKQDKDTYICNDCNEKFAEPPSNLLCLKCNNKFDPTKAKLKSSQGYKLN